MNLQYQASQFRSFFSPSLSLGTLHFFTSKGLGDICSNTYLILDFENLSLHPGFSIYSRSQFLSLHDRANDTGHYCLAIAGRASMECTYMYMPFELWRVSP